MKWLAFGLVVLALDQLTLPRERIRSPSFVINGWNSWTLVNHLPGNFEVGAGTQGFMSELEQAHRTATSTHSDSWYMLRHHHAAGTAWDQTHDSLYSFGMQQVWQLHLFWASQDKGLASLRQGRCFNSVGMQLVADVLDSYYCHLSDLHVCLPATSRGKSLRCKAGGLFISYAIVQVVSLS